MANPNIVSVSSIYGESIGEDLTTSTSTVLMTVASDKLLKVNFISVANWSTSALTAVTVSVNKAGFTSAGIGSGEVNAGSFGIVLAMDCPAKDSIVVLDKPIYLMEGDELRGGANPATAAIFISYEVIDDA